MSVIRFEGPEWINITHTKPVQFRLRTVASARKLLAKNREKDGGAFLLPQNCNGYLVQAQIPSATLASSGAYFFSSGDISTFMAVTGKQDFFMSDRFPFFSSSRWECTYKMPFEGAKWEREEGDYRKLYEAFRHKAQENYINNSDVELFRETAVFSLFEALELGGTNIGIHRLSGHKNIYRLTFDLRDQKYRIVFYQEFVSPSTLPGLLDATGAKFFMIKAGNRLKDTPRTREEGSHHSSYFLNLSGPLFPSECWIIYFDSIQTHRGDRPFDIPTFSLHSSVEVRSFSMGGGYRTAYIYANT